MDPSNDYVEIWHAADGWRWRRKDAGNHEIVSESGEAFTSHTYVLQSASELNAGLTVVDCDG